VNKTLILYRRNSVASFCDAWLAWIALGGEVDCIPLGGDETPDTSNYKEVIDVREIDPWDHFRMNTEPAYIKIYWVREYAHDVDKALQSSRQIQAALRAWPLDFDTWGRLAPQGCQVPFDQGTALLAAAERHLSFEDLLP